MGANFYLSFKPIGANLKFLDKFPKKLWVQYYLSKTVGAPIAPSPTKPLSMIQIKRFYIVVEVLAQFSSVAKHRKPWTFFSILRHLSKAYQT